ncbi:MAG: phytanoyl-CoA dioxygenase family protein [Anaerolineae bacterium]|nr:phytanoyl-CoA dioxygenase family protein [Gloeobacterales cyanobacterium ES-bin-313]
MFPIETDQKADFQRDGYRIFDSVFSSKEVAAMIEILESNVEGEGVRRKSDVYAVRNLLEIAPELRRLPEDPRICSIVEPILGAEYFVVRSLLFDKIPGANWKVGWHQDRTITVRKRIVAPGFGSWSTKAGIQHVQAPVNVLENMLALRIHLDDCGSENGPLRILPGSHRSGILTDEGIKHWSSTVSPFICSVQAGGILALRPLLLHASSPAQTPAHRRVIHLELASEKLPGGLEWNA